MKDEHKVLRYVAMLLIVGGLAIWIPLSLAPWIIIGPSELIKRVGRTGRHNRPILFKK